MVTIRLSIGLRHHIDGEEEILVESGSFINVIEELRIEKDEMGIVLVNNRSVDAKERQELTLLDNDVVDIYPIFGGG